VAAGISLAHLHRNQTAAKPAACVVSAKNIYAHVLMHTCMPKLHHKEEWHYGGCKPHVWGAADVTNPPAHAGVVGSHLDVCICRVQFCCTCVRQVRQLPPAQHSVTARCRAPQPSTTQTMLRTAQLLAGLVAHKHTSLSLRHDVCQSSDCSNHVMPVQLRLQACRCRSC
jgi:hypothetical protein